MKQPIFIDGLLYAAVAIFGFLQTQFGGEEAVKLLSPQVLFWVKTVVGALAAGALAVKLFRSTAYAEHQAKVKNGSGDTTLIHKP